MNPVGAEYVDAETVNFVAARHRNRPLGLPSTEKLLTEGGDARIAVRGADGSNAYGCMPLPDAELLSLGSSTASVISAAGFAAADRLRDRVAGAIDTGTAAEVYACELDRIRAELSSLCGIDHLAGLETVIGASGTDLHLIATLLVSHAASIPMRVIMVDAAETGSRVTTALSGCHFSSRAALGAAVVEGRRISPGDTLEIVNVSVRHDDGTPRPACLVDSEVEALVTDAASRGWRSLVVLVDVTKTGMIAPSPASVVDLRQRFADSMDVLVDACQFRITPQTLCAYLARDFMVAITGSKFVTGPTFSGALFIPASLARRFKGHSLPTALSDYSARAEWPRDWKAAAALSVGVNFGLLLRWEAALAELRAFRSIPERDVAWFFGVFAATVKRRLADDPVFEPLSVPALERGLLSVTPGWDGIQTIFPFVLHHRRRPGRYAPVDRDETLRVHRLLRHDLVGGITGMPDHIAGLRCQLGQPVACGERDGIAVSALRLCASARLAVEAVSLPDRNTAATLMERAVEGALGKTSGLVRALG